MVDINKLDSKCSILLKYGNYYKCSSKYIIFKNSEYISIFKFLKEKKIENLDEITEIFLNLEYKLKDLYNEYDDDEKKYIKNNINLKKKEIIYIYMNTYNYEINENIIKKISIFLNTTDDISKSTITEIFNMFSMLNSITYEEEQKKLFKIKIFQTSLFKIPNPIILNTYEIIDINKICKVSKISNLYNIDIFNYVNVTLEMPLIVYKYLNTVYSKIYKNKVIDYNLFNLKVINSLKENEIIIFVNIDNEYIECIYSINSSTLKFNIDDKSKINIIKQKITLLNIFVFDDIKYESENIRAKIDFTNTLLNIDIFIFHYLVLNNPIFNFYLIFDESNTALCDIGFYKYTLIEFFDIKIDFNLFTISETKSETDIILGLNILSYLFRLYNDLYDNIKTLFETYGLKTYTSEYSETINIEKKYEKLQKRAPEIFLKGKNKYTRICNGKFQPTIYTGNPDNTNLQILRFPHFNVKNHNIVSYIPLVCENPIYKYPYLQTHNLDNKTIYPYLPCCGLTNNIEKNNLKLTEITQQKSINYNYSKLNLKKVGFEEPGDLNPDLITFLQNGIENTDTDIYFNNFRRISTVYTPSSIIHCILYALGDKGYSICKNDIDRENYVIKKRLDMCSKISPLICKQELYDIEYNIIEDNINNCNIFLDPYLYYRILEEYFDINLYVINPDVKINQIQGIESETFKNIFIETPRSSNFYVKNNNNSRKTVLILKHLGAKSSNLTKYPICELIYSSLTFDAANKNKMAITETYLFNSKMSDFLFDCFQNTLNLYVWSFNYKTTSIECRNNPFNLINWLLQLPNVTILGQRFDNFGKINILGIKYNNTVFTLYVPPSQPLNVKYLHSLVLANKKDILKNFGNPTLETPEGIWYEILDFKYGIFIPYIINDNKINDSEYIINIKKVKNIKKYTFLLIELINWLWSLDNLPNSEFGKWWETYVDDKNEISEPIFPNYLKYNLPNSDSTLDGLNNIKEWWPAYFGIDKISLYSILYEKIYKYFLYKIKYLYVIPLNQLTNYYSDLEDFYLAENTEIFLTIENLENFLKIQLTNNGYNSNYNIIHTKLFKSWMTIAHPILFLDNNTNNIYIIQNVFNCHIENVITICQYWKYKKINKTFDAPPSNDHIISLNHIIYEIDSTVGYLKIKNNNSNQSRDYIQLLEYSNYQYAAILPLYISE